MADRVLTPRQRTELESRVRDLIRDVREHPCRYDSEFDEDVATYATVDGIDHVLHVNPPEKGPGL